MLFWNMLRHNTRRFDLSEWLIHFFRHLDLRKKDVPDTPGDWGFGAIAEDYDLHPFFLLRNAVRHNRLWATWSIRGNNRTIYGPHPAVCFTEMPLAAFIESGELRAKRGEAMSTYALMFKKEQLFKQGALPVIYGLSSNGTIPRGVPHKPRIIPEELLPLSEQYRYVSYSLNSSRKIDWTHEREWRYPYRGSMELSHDPSKPLSTTQPILPGLELSLPDFSGIGAVVEKEGQAERLIYDILTKVDRGEFSSTQYSHVLCLEKLPDSRDLRSPDSVDAAVESSLIKLEPYFAMGQGEAQALADRFISIVCEIEAAAPEPEFREFGGCWLWFLDNRSSLVRALVKKELVFVSETGRYLARLNNFSDSRSLSQREEMTKQLSDRLEDEFGVECTYFSVLLSDDPDGVPFYNGDVLSDSFFYNISDGRAE